MAVIHLSCGKTKPPSTKEERNSVKSLKWNGHESHFHQGLWGKGARQLSPVLEGVAASGQLCSDFLDACPGVLMSSGSLAFRLLICLLTPLPTPTHIRALTKAERKAQKIYRVPWGFLFPISGKHESILFPKLL